MHTTRRQFFQHVAAAALCSGAVRAAEKFSLRYALASSMYGTTPLAEILPEVRKTGATHIDVWPRAHGNQREQMDAMGLDAFAALLDKHQVKLGVLTRYDLGALKLQPEMAVAQRFGASVIGTGSGGPKDLAGAELKAAVGKFGESLKPHLAAAEKHGVTIAIENHGSFLINSPDSIRWLVEAAPSKHLGIAFAPYHLPQKPDLLADLITHCGPHLALFYAWEHGMGCMTKLPKEQELMQLPGRGPLDFTPLLAALKKINFAGPTEIFMHPTPRGIPILESTAKVTDEINRARDYLAKCQEKAG